MRQRESAPVAVDEGIMMALASLGYVDAGAPAPSESGNLKNPVDMADITHDYRWAEVMVGSPQSQQAIELLEAALKRSPESYALIELLGEAYATIAMQCDNFLAQVCVVIPKH